MTKGARPLARDAAAPGLGEAAGGASSRPGRIGRRALKRRRKPSPPRPASNARPGAGGRLRRRDSARAGRAAPPPRRWSSAGSTSIAHLDEDHPHPRPDADSLDRLRRGERPVRGDEVARDPERLVLGRLSLLGVEVDEEDQVGDEVAECGLDGMAHLGVGVDGPLPFHGHPVRFAVARPRTRGGRRVAEEAALAPPLEAEVARMAVAEERAVLLVHVLDGEGHPEVFSP